jgi:uncharacterized membrane protein
LPWGVTTGFGLGAVIDVVMFHLILQQHHLLSGYIDPQTDGGLRANVLYDGMFLLVMLAVMFLGLAMLWRWANGTSNRVSNTFLSGTVLVGAGVFNVFDGVVSHYVLGIHDVVHETSIWNPHWVVVSLVLLGVGTGLIVSATRRPQ